MSTALTSTKVGSLAADQAALFDHDGYLLLRGAVPEAWRDLLRAAFDAGVGTGEQWTAPKAPGWRYAQIDLDPTVRKTCRLPALLTVAAHMLEGPFFLAQVEGREPLEGGGHQPLHRDGAGLRAVAAMVFLDDYGPANGATRVLPRRLDTGEPDETLSLTLAGEAGDILVFDADLLHGATRNVSGARRRSLLLNFLPEGDRTAQDASRAIRDVRMDNGEVFIP
ncbi:phytanoyl-CoA dioxygenase family protein [Caulobacter endophyticus]|uniref:phytanoyl-CoA dioxygenase family protein n=1 Tax=Caulobacter endophyticus TaxID=2172652 RepID=UPI00240FB62C|nr:phytanoyl-CoA dioxygenase family protein [Caulobacter endophyticus]MDG2530059.1 phytanoyl-CoA dioxygenase family protein [Caulobacter endophyticus]